MSPDVTWLPYCGVLTPPAGTGGRMVEVERREGTLGLPTLETGLGDKLEWRRVLSWRYRDDLRPVPQPGAFLMTYGSSAIISPCGLYRYRLSRATAPHDANTVVIMVNPSTADAETDDATIRKLKGFGARNGWSNIIVGNLFAYRATEVRQLADVADPVGPENDEHLREMITSRDTLRLIFAWGPMGKLPKRLRARWKAVYQMALDHDVQPFSLGPPAKDGHPRHPLMLSYSSELQPWRPFL